MPTVQVSKGIVERPSARDPGTSSFGTTRSTASAARSRQPAGAPTSATTEPGRHAATSGDRPSMVSLTVQQARDIARAWLSGVAAGGDPSRDRRMHDTRRPWPSCAGAFLDEHAARRNKPGTAYNYQRIIERFVLRRHPARSRTSPPTSSICITACGRYPLSGQSRLGLFSKMMNLAERWGYCAPNGTNPIRHVDKNREGKRERYLSADETAASVSAGRGRADRTETLSRDRGHSPADVHRLPPVRDPLAPLGACRPGAAAAAARLARPARRLCYLNGAAVEVLKSLAARCQRLGLCRAPSRAHLVNLQKPWRRIRQLRRSRGSAHP